MGVVTAWYWCLLVMIVRADSHPVPFQWVPVDSRNRTIILFGSLKRERTSTLKKQEVYCSLHPTMAENQAWSDKITYKKIKEHCGHMKEAYQHMIEVS